ncbi:MAG: GNAT family N-acetyltransferase [Lachnospiraceae bacterium]|nr:GNAT family N-acetyltransferase [Lachnospiraceae bacterium]
MNVKLIKLTKEYFPQLSEMIDEWKLDQEKNHTNGSPWSIFKNDYLFRCGGHIGDGIRPSERGKGYATEMIRLSLPECKKAGIDRVLMVCDKTNIASAKTIIKNGGILENEVLDADGTINQRYWIDLR